MQNVLVIRFSSIGDVAISIPVISAALQQNEGLNIYYLTRKNHVPLLENLPNINVIGVDLEKQFKGFFGLIRLFFFLSSNYKISYVADIHDVLRTRVLRLFFLLSGKKVCIINKGRKEKQKIARRKGKVIKQLPFTFERYADVLRKCNLVCDLGSFKLDYKINLTQKVATILKQGVRPCIGIAPFAFFPEKMYPIEKMKNVIVTLGEQGYSIFLFGGGKKEKEISEEIEKQNNHVTSVISKLSFKEEVALINSLDAMITMDSANMHLTALTSTPLISIWGATHPYAGFSVFRKTPKDVIIQISEKELDCRPCSIFGKKKCFRNDLACLYNINPGDIVKAVNKIVKEKGNE